MEDTRVQGISLSPVLAQNIKLPASARIIGVELLKNKPTLLYTVNINHEGGDDHGFNICMVEMGKTIPLQMYSREDYLGTVCFPGSLVFQVFIFSS